MAMGILWPPRESVVLGCRHASREIANTVAAACSPRSFDGPTRGENMLPASGLKRISRFFIDAGAHLRHT